jgi:hypothetical protein
MAKCRRCTVQSLVCCCFFEIIAQMEVNYAITGMQWCNDDVHLRDDAERPGSASESQGAD